MELSDGTAHTITDAYAGKEYIIQVAAKDNEIGTWSDWSVAAHATPWTEEPRHLTTEAQAPGEPAHPPPILPCPTTSCAYALWLLLGAEPLPHTLSSCHRPIICLIPVFLVLVFYMSLVGIFGCNRSGWDPALALP